MRKFEIIKKTVEIKKKNASEIRKGVATDCEYPEVLKRFDTLEEAREAFKEFKTEIREFSTPSGKCFDIAEYYIEESNCDDDLPTPDIDVWEISPIEIRVVDDETHETVGVFSTYEDAIDEVNNSDVFLSIELF